VLRETNECIEWPHARAGRGEYGVLLIEGRNVYVHRLACERFHGPCPPGKEVAHECRNPICFNPQHLSWKTRQANLKDRDRHGTTARGERAGAAKLTEAQVQEIRRRFVKGTATALGAEFGVAHSTILRIISGRNWRQV
jgi:hypothetical protein